MRTAKSVCNLDIDLGTVECPAPWIDSARMPGPKTNERDLTDPVSLSVGGVSYGFIAEHEREHARVPAEFLQRLCKSCLSCVP